MRAILALALLLPIAACNAEKPSRPITLEPPPPPEIEPGEIRVWGAFDETTGETIRARIRGAEPRILEAYERHLATVDAHAEGRAQYRLGIDADGAASSVEAIYTELGTQLAAALERELSRIEFPPGDEAWAFYSFTLRNRPIEVLRLTPAFAEDRKVLIADVTNTTSFRIPAVTVTVRVMGPEKGAPLHISRRKLRAPFPPGKSRRLRIPVKQEFATERNSFFVSIRPIDPQAEPSEPASE